MHQPLTGIRVLELALGQQGPYAAMLLGDMGAAVIKVEPRWGDVARRVGVLVSGVSTLFTANNRNKRSLRLDLAQPAGRQILLRLLRHADVLVENFSPASLPRLGLDYETVRQHNPRLIYASASGYGPRGPHRERPSMDIIAQGVGGAMVANAGADGTPRPAGFLLADQTGVLVLVTGILLALSQVLWSLAYKFFWVTGGTDGIRVPTPSLLAGLVDAAALSYSGKIVTITTCSSSSVWC